MWTYFYCIYRFLGLFLIISCFCACQQNVTKSSRSIEPTDRRLAKSWLLQKAWQENETTITNLSPMYEGVGISFYPNGVYKLNSKFNNLQDSGTWLLDTLMTAIKFTSNREKVFLPWLQLWHIDELNDSLLYAHVGIDQQHKLYLNWQLINTTKASEASLTPKTDLAYLLGCWKVEETVFEKMPLTYQKATFCFYTDSSFVVTGNNATVTEAKKYGTWLLDVDNNIVQLKLDKIPTPMQWQCVLSANKMYWQDVHTVPTAEVSFVRVEAEK